MKKLSLKTEHLAELTSDELHLAVGGTYTGQTRCIVWSAPDACYSVASVNVSCVTRALES